MEQSQHVKHSELAEYLGNAESRFEETKSKTTQDAKEIVVNKEHPHLRRQSCSLGMAGEANGGVSACTQVEMKDTSRVLKFPEVECTTSWVKLPCHRRLANWDKIDDSVVLLDSQFFNGWERTL